MGGGVVVRRVLADEWMQVRDLRVEAVSDPDAAVAFLSTREEELARDDAFWRDRAATAGSADWVAQFVAASPDGLLGSATVLIWEAGATDHLGHRVEERRADVLGVYLRPSHRAAGTIDALLDAAASWAASRGLAALTLDVHVDNLRAQAAYRRCGFASTGVEFTSSIGPELQMRRVLPVS
ncbi:hypothetical protein ARHIZOSPH14_17200 [Agromyces rhizosphaerae]|uniref:N-acetyltransferase domain-containing protein n=2 Tax=Agromyces rhizosphaerae TaxID=88374 RepID=A0A9W6CS44_9MICO|nr:hypothetical protein ARHIZOSPH14_17200 [Agromyces rhizosphaerae]